jgi:hypothetical protein
VSIHQYFTSSFFIQKFFLRSFYVLTIWVSNFFGKKDLGTKAAHKMLVKLTLGLPGSTQSSIRCTKPPVRFPRPSRTPDWSRCKAGPSCKPPTWSRNLCSQVFGIPIVNVIKLFFSSSLTQRQTKLKWLYLAARLLNLL